MKVKHIAREFTATQWLEKHKKKSEEYKNMCVVPLSKAQQAVQIGEIDIKKRLKAEYEKGKKETEEGLKKWKENKHKMRMYRGEIGRLRKALEYYENELFDTVKTDFFVGETPKTS